MKGGLGSLLALGYLASVLRPNSRHSSQREASCPPGPGVRGFSGDQGPQPASSGSPCPAPAPPAAATAGVARLTRRQAGGRGWGGWASAGTVVRDAPEAQGPQRPVTSIPGALPCRLLGPGTASQRQPGKDNGGRKEESRPPLATAALSSRAAPALAPTRPSLRLGSKPENKTRVWEGGASAAGRTGSARLQAGEMLRHGANMDAGLLSFFSLEEQASPGAPKS